MNRFRLIISIVEAVCLLSAAALLFFWDFTVEYSWMVKVLVIELCLLAVAMQRECTSDYYMED